MSTYCLHTHLIAMRQQPFIHLLNEHTIVQSVSKQASIYCALMPEPVPII